jgi:hypothetical protein
VVLPATSELRIIPSTQAPRKQHSFQPVYGALLRHVLGAIAPTPIEELVANFLLTEGFAGRINDTFNFSSGALKDYHVIVVGMLGGGESSSPSNNVSFPNVDSVRYEDCIKSQYILVTEHLSLKSLDLVVGHSMRGQQAYYCGGYAWLWP